MTAPQAAAGGRVNIYTCLTCERQIVTVDRDEGTTPMFIGCRAPGRCIGSMASAGYPPLEGLVPSHEWYRPSLKWARRKGPAMLDHVRSGGLVLREIASREGNGESLQHRKA